MACKQAIKVNPERQRRRFTREFKLEAVRSLELGQKPATQLALELGVQRNQLYKWQAQVSAGVTLHAQPGRPRRDFAGRCQCPETATTTGWGERSPRVGSATATRWTGSASGFGATRRPFVPNFSL